MSVSLLVLPIMLLFTATIIAIPVLIGIYVYRDAKSRGMDAVLWTLVAIIVPSFIGLIIYLIVRKDHIILNCPKCGGDVQEHFATCPNCGQKLKANCSNCGTALNPEWKICPQCGKEITETAEFTPPISNKGKGNKGLLALIITIVAIPIVIIALLIVGLLGLMAVKNISYESKENMISVENIMTSVYYDTFVVMSASNAELEEEYVSWINEKKSEKDGIYCMTYESLESGGITPADGNYDAVEHYNVTYKYMILVINSSEDKAYNFINSNYTTLDNDIIVKNPSVMFNEVDADNGDEFENVFVIKFVSDYYVETNYRNEDGNTFKNSYDDVPLTVNITTTDGSFNYQIPTNQDESYIAFEQNVNSTEE